MKGVPPAYLMKALGSLPDKCKAAFIDDALAILLKYEAANSVWRPMPHKTDHVALTRIGIQTARLIDAINAAAESESATMLLRDAWLNLDRLNDETLGNPMPTLLRLQQAVKVCLPEKKRARRPVEKSPASSTVIITLADQFRRHFSRAPTFGSGSPFLRFVREALPAYGLFVPPLADIRNLAAGA